MKERAKGGKERCQSGCFAPKTEGERKRTVPAGERSGRSCGRQRAGARLPPRAPRAGGTAGEPRAKRSDNSLFFRSRWFTPALVARADGSPERTKRPKGRSNGAAKAPVPLALPPLPLHVSNAGASLYKAPPSTRRAIFFLFARASEGSSLLAHLLARPLRSQQTVKSTLAGQCRSSTLQYTGKYFRKFRQFGGARHRLSSSLPDPFAISTGLEEQ